MKKVVLVGGATGREHAIARQFKKEGYELSVILWANNEYIKKLCTGKYLKIDLDDVNAVFNAILELKPDYVVIGQGEVIQRGLCDMLNEAQIPCIGPTKKLAQLEGSKTFCRDLLEEIDDSLNPKHKDFYECSKELNEYINSFNTKIVIKCDGVITGPRVRIYECNEKDKAIENANNWIKEYGHIIVEEFINGYEVAIMSYTDGNNLIHTPVFKNHKRIGEGNIGENTSGMGTITGKECFPYINNVAEEKMHKITEKVLKVINKKCGQRYLGSLYGEFLVSGDDVKVIEYNCRFGNPSSMNILSIMKITFPELCENILNGTINELHDIFDDDIVSLSAYVVPKEYTLNKKYVGTEVDFSEVNEEIFYCGNMDYLESKFYLKNSRAFAICATANSIKEARDIVYNELKKVKGEIYYRGDIGNGK